MGYWDYDEPVWEPSEADELFNELKSKLVDAAKVSLKSDMESLKSRNEYLEKRNKYLEDKAHSVDQKEHDIEYKSRNLRREVEKEFYKAAIEDIFKDMIEKSQLWFAKNKPHEKPKCDKCDENRNWVLTWPNGEKVTKKCDCANPDYWYEPEEAWIDTLRYRIKDSNYQSERYYRLDKTYDYIGANMTIILMQILESSLYMISFAMMLLRSVNNLDMEKRLGLNLKKNVKSIVIG